MRPSLALSPQQADAAFKALASSHRREILRMLGEAQDSDKTCCAPHEVCACRISERLGLAASTVSFHMSALLKAGLVTGRKDGLWMYYTLRRDTFEALSGELVDLGGPISRG